jgi:hypothetical protein
MLLVLHPDSWETTRQLARRLRARIFRGQADASWSLETTLYRGAQQFRYTLAWLGNREYWMLRQFQRRAHHYINDPPSPSERLEWLALIQHHGGPTRLLDFTHSFYVAAFFALERAISDAAVWAINPEHLKIALRNGGKLPARAKDETADKENKVLIELADTYLNGSVDKLVLPVEPERMNERLSIQQGLFLLPCDISSSFEENLAATFGSSPEVFQRPEEMAISAANLGGFDKRNYYIFKIIIPYKSIRTALEDLQKMNVTSATLFPGLDGFARSLYSHLRAISTAEPDEEYFQGF